MRSGKRLGFRYCHAHRSAWVLEEALVNWALRVDTNGMDVTEVALHILKATGWVVWYRWEAGPCSCGIASAGPRKASVHLVPSLRLAVVLLYCRMDRHAKGSASPLSQADK